MVTFGEIVRYERRKQNWTVREFIKRLGLDISPAYITKIEKYGEIPSPDVVNKMAWVFNFDRTMLANQAIIDKTDRYMKYLQKHYGVL